MKMWYGCPKCGHKPETNKKSSSDNWKAYDTGPCPKCGVEMIVNFKGRK